MVKSIENLQGELFVGESSIVRVEGRLYLKALVWTTENAYCGHIVGTPAPTKTFEIFIRSDNEQYPIPYWFRTCAGIHAVISCSNKPRCVLNPRGGHPMYLLMSGQVCAWEAWDEDCVSEDQLEHDWLCLKALADSAADFS